MTIIHRGIPGNYPGMLFYYLKIKNKYYTANETICQDSQEK